MLEDMPIIQLLKTTHNLEEEINKTEGIIGLYWKVIVNDLNLNKESVKFDIN